MRKNVAEVRREIREHPERFDYGDCPPELTEAQKAAIDKEPKPIWLAEIDTKVAANRQRCSMK